MKIFKMDGDICVLSTHPITSLQEVLPMTHLCCRHRNILGVTTNMVSSSNRALYNDIIYITIVTMHGQLTYINIVHNMYGQCSGH